MITCCCTSQSTENFILNKLPNMRTYYDPTREAANVFKHLATGPDARLIKQLGSLDDIVHCCAVSYDVNKRIYGLGKLCDVVDASEGAAILLMRIAGYSASAVTMNPAGAFIVEAIDKVIEWTPKIRFINEMYHHPRGKQLLRNPLMWEAVSTFGTAAALMGTIAPTATRLLSPLINLIDEGVDIATAPYLNAGRKFVNYEASQLALRTYREAARAARQSEAPPQGYAGGTILDAEFEDLDPGAGPTPRSAQPPNSASGSAQSSPRYRMPLTLHDPSQPYDPNDPKWKTRF
jgi:hypothetical protein